MILPVERLDPPDERSPLLRFERYVVEPATLAYLPTDHLRGAQLEAVEGTPGWTVMTRDELLAEWRRRSA